MWAQKMRDSTSAIEVDVIDNMANGDFWSAGLCNSPSIWLVPTLRGIGVAVESHHITLPCQGHKLSRWEPVVVFHKTKKLHSCELARERSRVIKVSYLVTSKHYFVSLLSPCIVVAGNSWESRPSSGFLPSKLVRAANCSAAPGAKSRYSELVPSLKPR
jgi:hypothetical protein